MSNNKQTAVEWLIDELEKYEVYAKISYRCSGEIEIALDMEKEQIIDAYSKGEFNDGFVAVEDYYNEIYGGNNEQQ